MEPLSATTRALSAADQRRRPLASITSAARDSTDLVLFLPFNIVPTQGSSPHADKPQSDISKEEGPGSNAYCQPAAQARSPAQRRAAPDGGGAGSRHGGGRPTLTEPARSCRGTSWTKRRRACRAWPTRRWPERRRRSSRPFACSGCGCVTITTCRSGADERAMRNGLADPRIAASIGYPGTCVT